MNYDKWKKKYFPVLNPLTEEDSNDGCMFETYGKELNAFVLLREELGDKHCWTLLHDSKTIVAGMTHVNRLGFFVTAKAWTFNSLTDKNRPQVKIH